MLGLAAPSTNSRTLFARRADQETEHRGERQADDKRNERRVVTAGGVMHITKERRASGTQGVTVRVLPHHPDLAGPHEMALITWA